MHLLLWNNVMLDLTNMGSVEMSETRSKQKLQNFENLAFGEIPTYNPQIRKQTHYPNYTIGFG